MAALLRPALDGAPRLAPGALLVIPPRDLINDELRVARLSDYLDAEFPDLDVRVSEDRRLAGPHPAVGMRPRPDGAPVLSDAATKHLIGRVLDAVQFFIDYGRARH